MESILIVLIVAALVAVIAVLLVGVTGMVRGGSFNETQGNRMMRLRILLQAVAIALIAILVFIVQG